MPMKKTIRLFVTLFFLGFSLWPAAGLEAAGSPSPAAIKALIVTGQSTHSWKVSSAALERILDDSGLFETDIAVSPPGGGNMAEFAADFSPYRLVVLDYNGDEWPEPVKKALLDFVRSGGGVVVYHAADNAFPGWKEYNQITGLGFGGGRDERSGPYVFWDRDRIVRDESPGTGGYHGNPHAFEVVIRDSSHPVTDGLPERWMHATDELYSLMRGPGENMQVLATAYSDPRMPGSGRHEPVLFTVAYGKGRIFHTVLGHVMGDDVPPALQCVGFIVTFLRGAEWAATGKVTQMVPGDFPAIARESGTPDDIRVWPDCHPLDINKILEGVAAYDYGKDEEVLSRLRDYVRAHRNSPESRRACEKALADFLESDATLAGKSAVCRHLREIGSDACIPVLEKMLLKPETADMARYAIEKIPGDAAEKALLEGLSGSSGNIRLGIVASLGSRGAANAVAQLEKVLSAQDEKAAIASAVAIGKIASPDAVSVLSGALSRSSGELKDRIASSLLFCADKYMANGEKGKAADIYQTLIRAELPLYVSQAAMKEQIAASGDQARAKIVEALKGSDPERYAPAIANVKDFYEASAIEEVCALLPGIPAEYQVQLLEVLSHYREGAARASMLEALESTEREVRIAALRALEKAGNYTVLESLVFHAARSQGEEQSVARASIWGLKCGRADATILTILVKNFDEGIQQELILAVGERQIKEGLNLLINRSQYSSDRNRQFAIRALKNIASFSDLPLLVKVLYRMEKESDRMEMAETVAFVAGKSPRSSGRARAVMDELGSATDIAGRCALYRTLGKIGDDSSLPLLRSALSDENPDIKDAAVRALAEWPTPMAKDDLLEIAKTSEIPVHKVLALQSYIRMIGMEPFRAPDSAVRMFEGVLELARSEEKKLILGILPVFACPDAIELAGSLAGEKDVEAEARLAIKKIKEKLEKD